MDNINGHHNCKICNKQYKSYKSLWNHNKSFHSKNILVNIQSVQIVQEINVKSSKILSCDYCNKIFNCKSSKSMHKKVCKKKDDKNNNVIELEKIKLQQKEKDIEKLKEENEMIRLKIKLQNCKKIDNKTFKAVNKYLMNRSFKNSNNNNNTNSNNTLNDNTTNNNTINNNIFLSIGNEDLSNNLTMKEKKQILTSRYCSLEKIVELVHCRKHNKFKNILITNLKDNYAYKYDENLGYFITVTKTELLNDTVSYRITDIIEIYDELSTANKIDDKTKEIIQHMLDKLQDMKTPYYDDDGDTKYPNYKSYKINNIKILLYNNNDKMTNDIALFIAKDANKKSIDI
jgi:hypothetical protein